MRRRRAIAVKKEEIRIRLMFLLPAIFLATVLFLAANYTLNAGLMLLDKAPVRAHLTEAFESGALGLIESRSRDSWMGVHQTNDCLIFDMAARDTTDRVLYLFAGARTSIKRTPPAGNCELLRDWLMQDPLETFTEEWYLRYLHGYRAVAIALLEVMPVVAARTVMKIASYGVFVVCIFMNLVFLWRTGRRDARLALRRQAGYAILAGSLMVFFGLPYFGQSISHAPAILTLGGFIIAWSWLDGRSALNERSAVLLAIPYGLLTAYFEYPTGYIPVGACVIVALVAIGWSRPEENRIWPIFRVLFLVEATFAVSIGMAFVLHVGATALFHADGAEVATLFIERLAFRMSTAAASSAASTTDNTLTLIDVGMALLRQLPHLGFFGERGAIAAIGLSLGVCIFGSFDTLCSGSSRATKFRMLMSAGSFLPVAAWIFLFQNHTAIHAAFMVRILAVVPMAGAVTAWMWMKVLAEERDAGGESVFRRLRLGLPRVRRVAS
jgi:hypothetical protein